MVIVAKFASVCPCCSQRIVVGSKVEWSKGARAQHTACATQGGKVVAPAPARSHAHARGRWNGCACGAREMPDGTLSANACASCRYDNE
jgi:hypothetical protein